MAGFDNAGSLRTSNEGGKRTYTATMNFASTAGTDLCYFLGNGTVAQHTLTCNYTPTGGSFTLTLVPPVNASGSSPTNSPAPLPVVIPYNATAAQIQALINTATGGENCFVTGSALPAGTPVINWIAAYAGPQTIGTIVSALTGGTPGTITIASTTAGVLGNVQKITQIRITTAATAAAGGLVQVIRRSTADTGTIVLTNVSIAQLDQGSAAPFGQAVQSTAKNIGYFSTTPTPLGTAVATLASEQFGQGVLTAPTKLTFNFNQDAGRKPLVVRGGSDYIVVNAAAALAGSGSLWTVEIDFTEEGPYS